MSGYIGRQYLRARKANGWVPWKQFAFAEPPEQYKFPYASGVTCLNGYVETYYKDQFDVVHIATCALLSSSPADTWITIGTMPEGFRPLKVINAPCYLARPTNIGLIEVQTNGIVRVSFPTEIVNSGGSVSMQPYTVITCSYPTTS